MARDTFVTFEIFIIFQCMKRLASGNFILEFMFHPKNEKTKNRKKVACLLNCNKFQNLCELFLYITDACKITKLLMFSSKYFRFWIPENGAGHTNHFSVLRIET